MLKKSLYTVLIPAIYLLTVTSLTHAAVNDDFSAATPLNDPLPISVTVNNNDASIETGEPFENTDGPGLKSVWWSWTPATEQTVTIDTYTSGFDTILGVYTGTQVNSLTRVQFNDDSAPSGTTESEVTFTTVPGTTYWIAGDGFSGASGDLVLSIHTNLPQASNDNFSKSHLINDLLPTTKEYNNIYATAEADEPFTLSGIGGRSLWWKWIAPEDGLTLEVNTLNSNFNTIIGVYTGDILTNLTEIAYNDDDTGLQSKVTFQTVKDTTYRIVVAGLANSDFGYITLQLRVEPPTNDHFADAIEFSGLLPLSSSVINTGATLETGEPFDGTGTGGHTAWWKWIATEDDLEVIVDTHGSNFDTILGVYTGTEVTGLTEIVSNDDDVLSPPQSLVQFTSVASTTYWIAVDGVTESETGDISLQIKLEAPDNDDYSNATTLSGSLPITVAAESYGATFETDEPFEVQGTGGHSVWFKWTATSDLWIVADTFGSNFDTILGVYTGSSVDNLTQVALNDNAGGEHPIESKLDFQAILGTQYWICVDGADAADLGDLTLNLYPLFTPGSASIFSSTAVINTNFATDSDDNSSPQIVMSSSGTMLAVWHGVKSVTGSDTGTDTDIFYSLSFNGTDWYPPIIANSNALTDSADDLNPKITTDNAGNWIIVWVSYNDLGGTIGADSDILFTVSSDDGLSWSPVSNLSSTATTDTRGDWYPDIATDANGKWITVWTSSDPSGLNAGDDMDILYSSSEDNGSTWNSPLILNHSTDSGDADYNDFAPVILSNNNGTWIVAWESYNETSEALGNDLDILMSKSVNDGVTWLDAVKLNQNAIGDTASDSAVQLATDSAGTWLAVWVVSGGIYGTDTDIVYSKSDTNGGSWSAPLPFDPDAATDNTGSDWRPVVATNGNGEWVAVWYAEAGFGSDSDVIESHSFNNGASWTSPTLVNSYGMDDTASDFVPALLVNTDSSWLTIWSSYRDFNSAGTDSDIFKAQSDLTAPAVQTSIVQETSPDWNDTITFTVTFNEPVSGLTDSDFVFGELTGNLEGLFVSAVTPLSSSQYEVVVNTGTGEGTFQLQVKDLDTITDSFGIPLGGWGVRNGEYLLGSSYEQLLTDTMLLQGSIQLLQVTAGLSPDVSVLENLSDISGDNKLGVAESIHLINRVVQ